jgi:hypothetical protein
MINKELRHMDKRISQVDSIKVFNNMLENINKSVERNSRKNTMSLEIVNNLNFINILDERIKQVDGLEKEMQGNNKSNNNGNKSDSQNKKILNNKKDFNLKSKSKSKTNIN